MFQVKRDDLANGVQLILASATTPTNLHQALGDFVNVDSIENIKTSNLHRVSSNVKQTFINIDRNNRDVKLLSLVKDCVDQDKPVMIFAARTPGCNWLSHHLTSNGIENVKLNKTVNSLERLEAFERFQCGDVDVVCCTDMASRGLDTIRVRKLYLYNNSNNQSSVRLTNNVSYF